MGHDSFISDWSLGLATRSKMKKFSLFILLTLGFQCVKGNGDELCTQSAKLDLQLIVDSSKSVGEQNFHNMMEGIADSLVSQLDIGPDKTRVALFKYSKADVMVNEIPLNKFDAKKQLQEQIKTVKYEPGYTLTATAMTKALKLFLQDVRKDEHTTKVCIIFTDGEAADKSNVVQASKDWARHGVKVFAVGIGNGIHLPGLAEISGSEERVMEVKTFDEIAIMAKSLLKRVCQKIQPKKFLLTIANGNKKGKILFQPTDGKSFGSEWNTIPGWLAQVDSDKDIVAGCNSNLDIFVRVGSNWVQVPGKLKQVDVGDGIMAGVYKDGSIYVTSGDFKKPASLKWSKIPGGLKQISVGGGNIAGVNSLDMIYFRKGIDSKHPYGTSWLRIEGGLKMIAVGKNLAVGVNSLNDIYFRILSLGKPFGEKWQHIGGKLSSIYIENGVVFGVSPVGELFYRGGIDTAHPFGTTWVKDSSVKLSAPKRVVVQ